MIIPLLLLEIVSATTVSVGVGSASRGPWAEAEKKPVENIKPANRDAINRMGVKRRLAEKY